MKKVLKGWLIDNAVTTDNKTDKILLLASAGSLTLDDVLEEMSTPGDDASLCDPLPSDSNGLDLKRL